MNIEKLEIVPLRDAFRHEAQNFTYWLESNIDALSQRIGMELAVLEREKTVGSFNVDLFCEDGSGSYVIIENQLERTDHDHLGKLLTYMVNLEARTAIWVTPEVRPEHQRVIDWLNESTSADFSFYRTYAVERKIIGIQADFFPQNRLNCVTPIYLIRIEAVRISSSPYAPLFTVLAAPDEQIREIGETKKELADRHYRHKEFWTGFLERSQTRTRLFSGRSPTTDYWLTAATGRSGIGFNCLIFKDRAGIELYIDVGDWERNKAAFDLLYADRDAIDAEFGESLDWQRLDDKRASRIRKVYHGYGSPKKPETWPELQEMLIEKIILFDKVFRRRIAQIKL